MNICGKRGVVITMTPFKTRALMLPAAFLLLVAACGGSSGVETAVDAGTPSAAATAETNLPLLQSADDARDTQILSVADGSVSSLRDAADGDRPVLLWFWAPH